MEQTDFTLFDCVFTLEHATQCNKRTVPRHVAAYQYFRERVDNTHLNAALEANFSVSLEKAAGEVARRFSSLRVPRLLNVNRASPESTENLHAPSVRHRAQGLRQVITRLFLIAAVFLR